MSVIAGKRSQNGLPVLGTDTDGPLPRLRKFIIPGTGRHYVLRDGAVGFLIALWVLIYHETVERLNIRGEPWDEWGHTIRDIAGSDDITNHASGSAADTNATRHPLGVRDTYTPAQRRRMRRMLVFIFRGCLRHGEFYVHRVDGMHVETNAPFAKLERHARRLTRSKRGRRLLAANPGLREVIYS